MTPYYEDDTITLYHGDCLDILRELPDNSVDAIVTDPPYGLGFMGKEWDDLPPGLPWAQECLRVLKPGGHMLAFGGTRTWHRLAVAVEDAGFEIRDSIAWLYGQGFAKGRDFPRLDYAAQGDDVNAARWAGWNVALKPAHEPIVVARKPLVGTVAANVLQHGTGALNIDGCRVASSDADKATINAKHAGMNPDTYERPVGTSLNLSVNPMPLKQAEAHAAGRWPANVVLDGSQADALDEQSGSLQGRGNVNPTRRSADAGRTAYGTFQGQEAVDVNTDYSEGGGASRFFPTFRYQAKAPTRERPSYEREGSDGQVDNVGARSGRQCNVCGSRTVPKGGTPWPACGHEDWSTFVTENKSAGKVAHPTVKPLELMRWLVRLVTPPGGVVLEPFAGSGTTVEAALLEGFRCVAIEREADYLPLILARLERNRPKPAETARAVAEALALFDFEDTA